MDNNNNNQGLEALDILSILSFYIQIKALNANKEYTSYINDVINNIEHEIALLHEENDKIIELLEKILKK